MAAQNEPRNGGIISPLLIARIFPRPTGLGKILRNSQNICAYFMLNHRISCINQEKSKPSLTFNPGFAPTAFRTTGSRTSARTPEDEINSCPGNSACSCFHVVTTPPERDASPSQVTPSISSGFLESLLVPIYTMYSWERGTVRVKCIAQEQHNDPGQNSNLDLSIRSTAR